jgi:hypothetical protein
MSIFPASDQPHLPGSDGDLVPGWTEASRRGRVLRE